MSENIQSISQGTFTIGSTSATNFVAGPGITITEPSAGTVRIANDETVLWEDTSAGIYNGTITLNEPWSGFDKIGIEVIDAFGFGGKYEQFDTLNLAGNRVKNFGCSYPFILTGSPIKQYIRGCNLSFNNNEFTSGTVISYESVFTPTSTITCSTGGSGPRIVRVIGINRKEV